MITNFDKLLKNKYLLIVLSVILTYKIGYAVGEGIFYIMH